MQEFKNRLLEFIYARYNTSVRRFEEMCGLTNGTIASIKIKGPSADIVSKISDTCPELNLNWLFRGTGEMIIGESENKADSPAIEVSVVKTAGSVIVSDAKSLEAMIQLAVSKAINKI